jgi:plasmid stabilization system protein ParE
LREAIIDFGSSGYIARFRHLPGDDILIARIKHQKEDDFS